MFRRPGNRTSLHVNLIACAHEQPRSASSWLRAQVSRIIHRASHLFNLWQGHDNDRAVTLAHQRCL